MNPPTSLQQLTWCLVTEITSEAPNIHEFKKYLQKLDGETVFFFLYLMLFIC